jgi:lipopolysaccharide transport system ATP-binding protein
MAEPIIKVEKLGKEYRIGEYQPYYSLRESIVGLFRGGQKKSPADTIWALKNVNFAVREGEALGIIGKNGAGKSTLLKILSQITPPTTGRVTMRGRVGSLLEVGTGFHPELTGRENIYLNGAILGMGRQEIKRKFDEIVAFSEIEKFLDTPVKHYSSGMNVRLGFAVAAHLDPEILIVDEVLAVGDAQFQKKCLGKMEQVGREGRTVIFVSHNMAAIAQLCERTVLLHEGKVVANGPTEGVIAKYLSLAKVAKSTVSLTDWSLRRNSLENSALRWDSITLLDAKGKPTDNITFQRPFSLHLGMRVDRSVSEVRLGFAIQSPLGFPIFNAFQIEAGLPQSYAPGKYTFQAHINPNYLAPGLYEISLGANGPGVIDWIPSAMQFHVAPTQTDQADWGTHRGGIIAQPIGWKLVEKETQ